MGNVLAPTPVNGVCPNCEIRNESVVNVPGKAGTSGPVKCDGKCGNCGATVILTGYAFIPDQDGPSGPGDTSRHEDTNWYIGDDMPRRSRMPAALFLFLVITAVVFAVLLTH